MYPSEDNVQMYQIEKTAEFDKWLRKLQDMRAKAIILVRLQKIESDGHFGDCQSVGEGIRELKIDFAKGFRIYFYESEGKIVILLVGGDKSTQQRDIVKAKYILHHLNN